MNSSWASRRKNIIIATIVILLSAVSFAVFWKFWYRVPTCFDGRQNGDEAGIDCGGSCSLVCDSGVIQPIVKWDPRLFEVLPGLWSILVYVENPNPDVEATYVPYNFVIYDENNNILEERKGATILPKNKTVGIFEGSIMPKTGTKPKRAIFSFGEKIVWKKNNQLRDNINITSSPLLRLNNEPRIEANLKNNGIEEIKNIELVAVVFDGADNAIAASRTFVESLKKNENTDVFFTWPRPFELGSKVCEKPSDIVLLLDRSGSMAVTDKKSPQPLSEAKIAAVSFIDQLGGKDKVGIISFATNAKNPPDFNLGLDLNSAKQAVNAVEIESGSTQYTNIYEVLHLAWQELISARAQEGASKIMVLLTDGIANNPRDPVGRTEADDIKYAEELAIKESLNAKKDGLIIYTIGLGEKINEAFLKTIASQTENYFFAPSALNLEAIYKNISYSICKEVPARIEITYKIFGASL